MNSGFLFNMLLFFSWAHIAKKLRCSTTGKCRAVIPLPSVNEGGNFWRIIGTVLHQIQARQGLSCKLSHPDRIRSATLPKPIAPLHSGP